MPTEQASYHLPVDDIEPLPNQGEARDICKRFLFIMNLKESLIEEAKNKDLQRWASNFALGLGVCAGVSMESKAQSLGVTVASISKLAVEFCKLACLPPSPYMRSEKSRDSYREARNNAVRNSK